MSIKRQWENRSASSTTSAILPSVCIELHAICKAFVTHEQTTIALKNIQLSIYDGEFVCVVGPSGCGKSTLLNIIAGLEQPDSGEVLLNGEHINGPGRNRIVVFQEHALFPWLNVLGNVLFGLKLKPGLSSKDRLKVARYYLQLVGLSHCEKSNIHELSGGMRQRVALARALAPDPHVLLMDEPFGALDLFTREQLYIDIQRFWEGRKTIVFVTHNVHEAVCLGDRVVLFTPNPGSIAREFIIPLSHPRDINSIALIEYASHITMALKDFPVDGVREVAK